MADEKQGSGWTRFFRKKELAGEDFFGKFISGLARIFEGGDEEETYRQVRAEVKQIFECDDISLFAYDPHEKPSPEEGDWVMTVKSGFGEGNRVSQAEARSLPDLQPGRPLAYTDDLAQAGALKAIALAFEENTFYGCDIEKKKVVLLKDPRPEDDLGSGDLSVLAIPLRYHSKVGRVVEQTRVGVLALFKTPMRQDMGDLEKGLRSLLAHALVTPSCMLRDPVTRLYTETFMQEELARYLNMWDMTAGQLNGALVVGLIDCLKLYKQTLETAGKVDPTEVGQKVSDAMRGVAACLWRRCTDHTIGPDEELRCGVPGRLGASSFAAVVPLLKPHELGMWCTRLSQEVVKTRFEAEEFLATKDLTVSLRIIPFGQAGARTPAEVWRLAKRTVDEIEIEQARARRDAAALKEVCRTVKIWQGAWVAMSEFKADQLPPAPRI